MPNNLSIINNFINNHTRRVGKSIVIHVLDSFCLLLLTRIDLIVRIKLYDIFLFSVRQNVLYKETKKIKSIETRVR